MPNFGFRDRSKAEDVAEVARQNPPGVYSQGETQIEGRNWVVLTPEGGIPGMSATDPPEPGRATCLAFYISAATAQQPSQILPDLNALGEQLSIDVVNISEAPIPAGIYLDPDQIGISRIAPPLQEALATLYACLYRSDETGQATLLGEDEPVTFQNSFNQDGMIDSLVILRKFGGEWVLLSEPAQRKARWLKVQYSAGTPSPGDPTAPGADAGWTMTAWREGENPTSCGVVIICELCECLTDGAEHYARYNPNDDRYYVDTGAELHGKFEELEAVTDLNQSYERLCYNKQTIRVPCKSEPEEDCTYHPYSYCCPDPPCDCHLYYEEGSSAPESGSCEIGFETGDGTRWWATCKETGNSITVLPSDFQRTAEDPTCTWTTGATGSDGDNCVCVTECGYSDDCVDDGTCLFVELSNATTGEPPDLTPPLAQAAGDGYSDQFYHAHVKDTATAGAACHAHYWNFKHCGSSGDLVNYQSTLATWVAAQGGGWSGNSGDVPGGCDLSSLEADRATYLTCVASYDLEVFQDDPVPNCCEDNPGPGPGDSDTGCCTDCYFPVNQQTGISETFINDFSYTDWVTADAYVQTAPKHVSVMEVADLSADNDPRYVSRCRWNIPVTLTLGNGGGDSEETVSLTYQGGVWTATATHPTAGEHNLDWHHLSGGCSGINLFSRSARDQRVIGSFDISGGQLCDDDIASAKFVRLWSFAAVPGGHAGVLVGTAIVNGQERNVYIACVEEGEAGRLAANAPNTHFLEFPYDLNGNGTNLPDCAAL